MRKKVIMVTGSAGFLGSALFEMLRDEYIIYGIDIKDGNDLFNIKSIVGVDIVIHCAALTSVTESAENPYKYYRENIVGTSHIINLCMKYNAQLIYISSAAIFDPASSVYADSKELAHEIVYRLQEEINALIFVPYNIYSLNPKPGSLFHHFLTDPELYVYGTGKQTRDFISIVDVCNIIKTAIDENWQPDTIELGTGKQTSVKEIAEMFHNETGKKIVHRKQSGGIKHSIANTQHLREHYIKALKTNLKRDIKEMIKKIN